MDKHTVASIIKDYDKAYFAVVDEFEEVKGEGPNPAIKVKDPKFREQVFCINEASHVDPQTGRKVPAKCVKLVPNRFNGVYQPIDCNRNVEDAKKCLTIMLGKVEENTNPIIGPFATFEEAVQAQNKLRKPTPTQKVQLLEVTNAKQSEELSQLKSRIAELEKKGSSRSVKAE